MEKVAAVRAAGKTDSGATPLTIYIYISLWVCETSQPLLLRHMQHVGVATADADVDEKVFGFGRRARQWRAQASGPQEATKESEETGTCEMVLILIAYSNNPCFVLCWFLTEQTSNHVSEPIGKVAIGKCWELYWHDMSGGSKHCVSSETEGGYL